MTVLLRHPRSFEDRGYGTFRPAKPVAAIGTGMAVVHTAHVRVMTCRSFPRPFEFVSSTLDGRSCAVHGSDVHSARNRRLT
jgi:hypothetical protein